jgi:hypothetical protein
LNLSKNLVELIVDDIFDKKERVSEDEILVIKKLLQDTNALNERNKMILEVFGG